jgi:hypothetical protein
MRLVPARLTHPPPPRPLPKARRLPLEDEPAWREWLLHVDPRVTGAGIAVRALLLAGLLSWTVSFLRHGLDSEHLMGSFLHLVNLPFHEAGHIFLAPFGRFLTVFGGSLLQVLVPLVCGAVFLSKNREPFAAAVMAWWAGESLMDLAPYIADARALRLPLLGGRTGAEVEGHDWEYLLQTTGLLAHDVTLGRLSFALGALAMVAALAWAAAVLLRERAVLRAPRES